MRKIENARWAVPYVLLLSGSICLPAQAQAPETPAFHEFTARVHDYIKLHKESPRLRTTRQRKEIVSRRAELAQTIRTERANARQGDIFTPEASKAFRLAIQSAFQGPNAPNVRKTIRQGEPVPAWQLKVNGDYPEHLPRTTFPPTLLQKIPQLPAGVAYRIIGHDFVLQDSEARLVIDFIPGALP